MIVEELFKLDDSASERQLSSLTRRSLMDAYNESGAVESDVS